MTIHIYSNKAKRFVKNPISHRDFFAFEYKNNRFSLYTKRIGSGGIKTLVLSKNITSLFQLENILSWRAYKIEKRTSNWRTRLVSKINEIADAC